MQPQSLAWSILTRDLSLCRCLLRPCTQPPQLPSRAKPGCNDGLAHLQLRVAGSAKPFTTQENTASALSMHRCPQRLLRRLGRMDSGQCLQPPDLLQMFKKCGAVVHAYLVGQTCVDQGRGRCSDGPRPAEPSVRHCREGRSACRFGTAGSGSGNVPRRHSSRWRSSPPRCRPCGCDGPSRASASFFFSRAFLTSARQEVWVPVQALRAEEAWGGRDCVVQYVLQRRELGTRQCASDVRRSEQRGGKCALQSHAQETPPAAQPTLPGRGAQGGRSALGSGRTS